MEPNGKISMYKLIINRVVLSILIFSSEMVLYACGDNRNETGQVQILEEVGEELTDAEEDSVIQDSLTVASPQEEVKTDEENKIFIRGSIPDGSREVINTYLIIYIRINLILMTLNYMKRKMNCIINIGSNLLIRAKLMRIRRIFAMFGQRVTGCINNM